MAVHSVTDKTITTSATTIYETGQLHGREKTYTVEISNTGSTNALTDFRLEALSLAGGTAWRPVLNGTSSNDWVVANGFVHQVYVATTANLYTESGTTLPTLAAEATGYVTFTIPEGFNRLRFRAIAASSSTTVNFYLGEAS